MTTEPDLEYTPVQERLITLPNTWTHNATIEIARLWEAVKALQESVLWLESAVAELEKRADVG